MCLAVVSPKKKPESHRFKSVPSSQNMILITSKLSHKKRLGNFQQLRKAIFVDDFLAKRLK